MFIKSVTILNKNCNDTIRKGSNVFNLVERNTRYGTTVVNTQGMSAACYINVQSAGL